MHTRPMSVAPSDVSEVHRRLDELLASGWSVWTPRIKRLADLDGIRGELGRMYVQCKAQIRASPTPQKQALEEAMTLLETELNRVGAMMEITERMPRMFM